MTPQEARDLAYPDCTTCGGLGWWFSPPDVVESVYCDCVWRQVYKICYRKYRYLRHTETTRIHILPSNRGVWLASYPREEYKADFELLARRYLKTDLDYTVWYLTAIKEQQWRQNCEYMRCDRGRWFRYFYHMQQEMGFILSEIRPYPLYPPREYFGKGYYNNYFEGVQSLVLHGTDQTRERSEPPFCALQDMQPEGTASIEPNVVAPTEGSE